MIKPFNSSKKGFLDGSMLNQICSLLRETHLACRRKRYKRLKLMKVFKKQKKGKSSIKNKLKLIQTVLKPSLKRIFPVRKLPKESEETY